MSAGAADFEAVVRRFAAPLFRYCLRETGDAATAEDMVQETFLRTFETVTKGPKPDNLGAWLFGVARNVCREARRKDARGMPPAGAPARSAENEKLTAAMESLDDEERCLLHLKHGEGRSCREIAEILGSPLGTVTSALARAYGKLRGKMT